MRVLRPGMTGGDVLAWELFLRGQGYYWVEADGNYDPEAVEATKAWQEANDLNNDGEVGLKTYGKAQLIGFNPGFEDANEDEFGPNWPPKPNFPPMSFVEKTKIFGQF